MQLYCAEYHSTRLDLRNAATRKTEQRKSIRKWYLKRQIATQIFIVFFKENSVNTNWMAAHQDCMMEQIVDFWYTLLYTS